MLGWAKEPRGSAHNVIPAEALGQRVTCFAFFQVNNPNKQEALTFLNEATM